MSESRIIDRHNEAFEYLRMISNGDIRREDLSKDLQERIKQLEEWEETHFAEVMEHIHRKDKDLEPENCCD